MKKISVQETLIRETIIEVDDQVFTDLRSDDQEKRRKTQEEIMRVFYDETYKTTNVYELEWVDTRFVSSEDEGDEVDPLLFDI